MCEIYVRTSPVWKGARSQFSSAWEGRMAGDGVREAVAVAVAVVVEWEREECDGGGGGGGGSR